MLDAIYPKNLAEWAALVTAISPLLVWAFSSILRTREISSERRESEWRRIHDLTAMLHNAEDKIGYWQQVLAIEELRRFRGHRGVVHQIATRILQSLQGRAVNPEIIPLLEKLVNDTKQTSLLQRLRLAR